MSYLVAGVGTIQLFDPSTNALILTSKTLTEEGINFSSTAEEARGGAGNALLGKYYHDSTFGLTLTDQLFDLQYLALNCGGSIQASSDVMINEQVTISVANTITVTQTPVEFNGQVIGWAKKSNQPDSAYRLITFTGKNATIEGASVGDIYCVKYFYNSSSARKFVVNTAYIPATVYAVATFPMFKAGTSTENYTSSSQVGEIQVIIPNFQLEASQELSLSSGGISTASISGSALATYSGNGGCSDGGYYAIITEHIYGKSVWDNVVSLAVYDSDIDLASAETQTITVYAIYSDGTVPSKIDNSYLTFTSSDDAVATVTSAGVVTATGVGTANIEIVATDNTNLSAYAVVTVS
jgi:hypothetical protein